MSTSARPITEYVEVGRRFRRSVNLEKDYRGALQNGEYIITPTALEALHRFREGLTEGSPSRAWTITGPYGVGKSAFAVFLTRLLCCADAPGSAARSQLKQVDPELAVELSDLEICNNGAAGLLPVLVTARRASAPQCIAEGMISTLKAEKSRKLKSAARKLASDLNTATNGTPLDTRWVVSALDLASQTAKDVGYKGVLVIIDELGKFFEYAARYPQKGDVFVLQELAEYVVRSNDFPAVLVGLLHQSFEEYGHHLDIGTRREWSKIQGRFGDVAFLEPADQVIRMVAAAIRWRASAWPRRLKSNVERVVTAAADLGVAPPGMPIDEFKRTATLSYPLHPLTLVALPYIFRRFAQNERSLFSYLSSMEPKGFQEFVKTKPMNPKTPEFIRLGDLFDYFTNNFGLGLYRQPQALRWLEAADVLERKDELGELHREVVKTIGVLSALGQFCHLSASAGMISLAVQNPAAPNKDLHNVLTSLKEASVLTYRTYNKSYRIWEGSDVDIEERIAEGERKTQRSLGLADRVREYIPSRPMVARRHSFETGALRSFEVLYIDSVEALDGAVDADTAMDGNIVVCLAESTPLAGQFRGRAVQAKEAQRVLFAIPQQIGELRGIVTELGALRWVWENTPELRDDRVARREVSLRITEAKQLMLRHLNGLVDPRPEPIGSKCLWFYAGSKQRVSTPVDVSQLLSDVCDRIYDKSPRIRNELVVRRSLSSAAAAARMNLVQAMMEKAEQPLLGMEGYPPGRSIYESVLHATGIHREQKDGTWVLVNPTRSHKHNLYPCWKRLGEIVFDPQTEPVPVNVLFSELSAPPFGLLDGLHPLLLCAFVLVHSDETTLYREGTFLPEPSVADFRILMRRPELFALAGSRVKGGRAAVVERLAKGLKVKAATVPVVRALFNMVKGLPDFAWKTHRLPKTTIALRDAFTGAQSPERFLFADVPEALGFDAFSENPLKASLIKSFFSRLNENLREWAAVAPQIHTEARDVLLKACGIQAGQEGWNELRQRSLHIEPSVTDPQLLDFVRRVVRSDSNADGIASTLAFVADRPPHSWTDIDVQRFRDVAGTIGRAFLNATRLVEAPFLGAGIDGLNTRERRSTLKLVAELHDDITARTGNTPKKIVRAALGELLQRIAGEDEDQIFHE